MFVIGIIGMISVSLNSTVLHRSNLIDLKSESETDEYQESSVGEEDPEPDDTEYLPSERMRLILI